MKLNDVLSSIYFMTHFELPNKKQAEVVGEACDDDI